MASSGPALASGADLQALARRPMADGGMAAEAFQLTVAQSQVKKILEDDAQTFRTMVTIGLPTASLQMPSPITFPELRRWEARVANPDAFMDAAIE